MSISPEILRILSPAFQPCPEFKQACSSMRWMPTEGHVPRGFYGAFGSPSEIELVLVFAEPGDPHSEERHCGIQTAFDYTGHCFRNGKDQFHKNVRHILDLCWPDTDFDEQMRKTWLTESVLCSAELEGGGVASTVTKACGQRYLKQQIDLFSNALIVALGRKAKRRLIQLGISDFLAVAAAAPPGCNRAESRASWNEVPQALNDRRTTK